MPVVIQTNASEYGLETALIQDGRLTAFASKSPINIETRYANIEYECLSVCFGLEKFHIYLYGRDITEHNHKPLKMIQQKLIHAAPPIYKECYYIYKSMIIQFNTSQEKKWSWQTASANSITKRKHDN